MQNADSVLCRLAVLAFLLPALASAQTLEYLERQEDGYGLEGARGVAVAPGGAHVYVASRDDSTLLVYARDAATGALALAGSLRDVPGGVPSLDQVQAVVVSPDGAHVYAAAFPGRVTAFARDAATGLLTAVDVEEGEPGLGGASGLAISADGAHLYLAAGLESAVVTFARDPATGALQHAQALFDGQGGVDGLGGATSLALSPGGAHLYVTAENDDAVAIFTRDAATGLLTFAGAAVNGSGASRVSPVRPRRW